MDAPRRAGLSPLTTGALRMGQACIASHRLLAAFKFTRNIVLRELTARIDPHFHNVIKISLYYAIKYLPMKYYFFKNQYVCVFMYVCLFLDIYICIR